MKVHKIFVTSDSHYGHRNILHLGKGRPFRAKEHMDEALIERWNSVVSDDDVVYHLGDISWYGAQKTVDILERLRGKIRVLWGNHDAALQRRWNDPALVACPFKVVDTLIEINVEDRKFVLCHYPIEEWNGFFRGAVHLHGHCHGNLKREEENRFDVGVDLYNGYPVEITADLRFIKERPMWKQ